MDSHQMDPFEKFSQQLQNIMKNPQLKVVAWEATRNCNLNCIHCLLPKDNWKAGKRALYR